MNYFTFKSEDMARNALNVSKKAHQAFSAMVDQLGSRSCKIEDLKGFFDLVQKVDSEWLEKEARSRAERIEKIVIDENSPLNSGVELNRLTALRFLKEEYGV